jgi:ATP/maltotriose-dependent transcriptional regulator MalT
LPLPNWVSARSDTLSGISRRFNVLEDPFYRVEALTLKARLRAYRGSLDEALATHDELVGVSSPPRALGSHLAAHSILLAASGDAERARRMAATARGKGSNIEMIYFAELGEIIADGVDGESERFRTRAGQIVINCHEASYLDGLVFAYRVYPPLVEAAGTQPEAAHILATLLAKSRDHELARLAGIDLCLDETNDPLDGLTRREIEVLRLLSQGMTTAEIANHLFIARSTAKVHIRHIFEKLGVRTRLQAALKAQEIFANEVG